MSNPKQKEIIKTNRERIIDLLKEKGREMSKKEISDILQINTSNLGKNLTELENNGRITCEKKRLKGQKHNQLYVTLSSEFKEISLNSINEKLNKLMEQVNSLNYRIMNLENAKVTKNLNSKNPNSINYGETVNV